MKQPFYLIDDKILRIYYYLNRPRHFNLLENDAIQPENYIFAQERVTNIETKTFVFFQATLQDFHQLFHKLHKSEHRFYAVVLSQTRYFYLDCDLTLLGHEKHYRRQIQVNFLFFVLVSLRKMFDVKFNPVIWCAHRAKSTKKYKISYHIIIPEIKAHYLVLKHYAQKIKYYLRFAHQRFAKAIDLNVYHKLQMWRLPFNNTKDVSSELQPMNISSEFVAQIKLNFLNPIEHNLHVLLVNHKIKNKQYTWFQMNKRVRNIQKYQYLFAQSVWTKSHKMNPIMHPFGMYRI